MSLAQLQSVVSLSLLSSVIFSWRESRRFIGCSSSIRDVVYLIAAPVCECGRRSCCFHVLEQRLLAFCEALLLWVVWSVSWNAALLPLDNLSLPVNGFANRLSSESLRTLSPLSHFSLRGTVNFNNSKREKR